MPPKTKTTASEPHDDAIARLLATATASCARALATLDHCVKHVSAKLTSAEQSDADPPRKGKKSAPSDGYDEKLASHLAWLTKNIAQIMGEVRKLDAHERKGMEDLNPASVLAWLRQADPGVRGHVVRELEGMDRSVLS